MELREWLWRNGGARVMAERVGYTASYIRQVANGKRLPKRVLIEAISRATDGVVTVQEIIDKINSESKEAVHDERH